MDRMRFVSRPGRGKADPLRNTVEPHQVIQQFSAAAQFVLVEANVDIRKAGLSPFGPAFPLGIPFLGSAGTPLR